jgi:hypothetical protein
MRNEVYCSVHRNIERNPAVAGQTDVFQHPAKPWRRLRAGLWLTAVLTILTSGSLGFTQDLPRVALECPSVVQRTTSPFELSVTISWQGDAQSHVILPPEPVFPESFRLRASSFEATVSDSCHQLTYRFILMPHQTGRFTISPVTIPCWPRDSSTELSLLTNECTITVEPVAGLFQKKSLATAAAIILAIISAGVYIIKKRSGSIRPSKQPTVEADHTLVQQCRRERLQGDYTAFYTTALKAALALMPADQTLHNRIAARLERAQFSNQKPSAEDADHILRQLKRALDRTKKT